MTEREKSEICKGYADLIIRKEQLIREIWETEFAIRKIENILTRNRINYINKNTLNKHRYQDKFTEETYRTESGIKVALPTYYRQKIWTDQQREALRIIKEEKQVKYYNKTPIKVETIKQYKEYVDAVKYWQSIKKYDRKRKK